MTFKRQMEKAVKAYLATYGFKVKKGVLTNASNGDIVWYFLDFPQTHFRFHYYYYQMNAFVHSSSLNEILYEVTDGKKDFRGAPAGPIIQGTSDGKDDVFFSEFFEEQPMEENMERFKHVFETKVWPVYQKFRYAKDVYTALAHNEDKKYYSGFDYFYYPLAYFFDGSFEEAFKYIDKRIDLMKKAYEEHKEMRGASEFLENIDIFEAYKKNLKKWIAEKRTFEVDSIIMPDYGRSM